MITGVHALIYSPDAERVRAFLRDVLGWPSVDAGGGWPTFAMPPSEIAVHPTHDGSGAHTSST
jgi:catechol 2,3-dioxygenase-like lactoylglutathione lyase family enzyme